MADNAGAIRAGRAFVELYAVDVGLVQGLNVAKELVRSFADKTRSIGAFLVNDASQLLFPYLGAARVLQTTSNALESIAHRSKTTTDIISALGFAFAKGGATVDETNNAIATFTSRLADATVSGAGVTQLLAKLGINAQDLYKLPLEEQIYAIARAFERVKDPADKANLAIELFGSDVSRSLEVGAQGLRNATKEAIENGLIFRQADANKVRELSIELGQAWTAIKNAVVSFGAALLPEGKTIREYVKEFVRWLEIGKRWLDQNRAFVAEQIKFSAVELGVGVALIAATKGISLATGVFGGLGSVVKFATAAFGGAAAPIKAVGGAGRLAAFAVGTLTAPLSLLKFVLSTVPLAAIGAAESVARLGVIFYKVGSFVGGFASLLGKGTGAFRLLTGAGKLAFGLFLKAGDLFGVIGFAAKFLGAPFKLLGLGIGVVINAVSVFGGVLGLLFTPLGLAAAAIAGIAILMFGFPETLGKIGGEILRFWESFSGGSSGYFSDVWKNVKDTFGLVVELVSAGDLNAAWDVTTAGFKAAWTEMSIHLTRIWNDFKEFFMGGFDEILQSLRNTFPETMKSAEKAYVKWSQQFGQGLNVISYKLGLISKEEGAMTNHFLVQDAKKELDQLDSEIAIAAQRLNLKLPKLPAIPLPNPLATPTPTPAPNPEVPEVPTKPMEALLQIILAIAKTRFPWLSEAEAVAKFLNEHADFAIRQHAEHTASLDTQAVKKAESDIPF